jgi:hypothetical protein
VREKDWRNPSFSRTLVFSFSRPQSLLLEHIHKSKVHDVAGKPWLELGGTFEAVKQGF